MKHWLALGGLFLTFAAVAQTTGVNGQNGNRPGGISFVTRRLPTAGVVAGTGGFMGSGVAMSPTAGTAAVTTGPVAVTGSGSASGTALADVRVQAALRQLARQGDPTARQLLQTGQAGAGQGTAARPAGR